MELYFLLTFFAPRMDFTPNTSSKKVKIGTPTINPHVPKRCSQMLYNRLQLNNSIKDW